MPAIDISARALRRHALRASGSALALIVLGTAMAGTSSPVEATNWSRHIAATRSRQVAYEAAMRAADQQLRSLGRDARRAQRQLAKSKRHLRQVRQRQATAESRYRISAARLKTARLTSVAQSAEVSRLTEHVVMPFADPFAANPAPAGILPSEWQITTADQEQGADVSLIPATPVQTAPPLETTEATEPDGVTTAAVPWVADRPAAGPDSGVISQATVDALEQVARKDARALRKAERKLRRAATTRRTRARTVASLKWSRRAAVGRRQGAEAGLASAILSMSRLAQRRVAKKTDVRPGHNSGFAWPTRGRITQRYGCTGFYLNPARGSCRHFHDGVDVAGYRGTPIRAAAVGVVSYIGWNPWDEKQRAFMIVVAHPGGYETLYGHVLPTRRVRVGQLVRRGELIGYMGNTGRSTGVHLHLELRRGRTTMDPLGFF